jgi:glycogen synthase
MVETGMLQDWSWNKSAEAYSQIYALAKPCL